MRNFVKTHFPENRSKFKLYLRYFIPITLGTLFYALNGIVDNFMVGRIDQGVTALSAANQWGFFLFGWFFATAAAGSVIMSQFYHDGNREYVKKISRYRAFLCFIFVIPFCIIAWTYPQFLISAFYKFGSDPHSDALVFKHGREYLEITAIQWIFIVFSFNMGSQFAELGEGKYRMYFGLISIFVNIFLNYMLIFIANMGVRGAALATLGGRIIYIFFSFYIIRKKKLPISINIFRFYQMDKKLLKIYWRRWVYFISTFTVTFFIVFRGFFYARGFVAGSLGVGVSGTSVLGLTGAIMNLFTITFSAIGSMTALFVSSELGKGNYKQAHQNANELKGFNTFMAFCLSMAMLLFATFIPMMKFLSADQYNGNELRFSSASQLYQVRNSLFVIASMYPMWIWFSTSYRNGNAGGKGKKFAIFDWISTGPIQLGWLAIVMLVIVPSWEFIQDNFALAYALFFASDFIKLIGFEKFYYANTKWLYSITRNET